MKKKKPRTWVKTFMPSMAPKVEAGTKRQTIRPWPKRAQDIPRVGHRISCREWTGRPYNSKQRVLCGGKIIGVFCIVIWPEHNQLFKIRYRRSGAIRTTLCEFMSEPHVREVFAKADGFESGKEFREWFLKGGTRCFKGVLIKWEPDGKSSVAR